MKKTGELIRSKLKETDIGDLSLGVEEKEKLDILEQIEKSKSFSLIKLLKENPEVIISELNKVLDIVPVFLDVAVDQLKNGRKWNDIFADEIEASKFIKKAEIFMDESFKNALYFKLKNYSEFSLEKLKEHLEEMIEKKEMIDNIILDYYKNEGIKYLEKNNLHILQKMLIKKLTEKLK